MRRLVIFALLFFVPTILHARVISWSGKPISVAISTERLTRIEFPESLRSIFLSRLDIGVERDDKSLFVRALDPDAADTVFIVGDSGATYEMNLSVSDNPDSTVIISSFPKQLQTQVEQAKQVPVLDLMRSMMRGLPVSGYEIIKAKRQEVYRDAHFSMKLIEIYRSPALHGYVIEVENLADFPVLLRVQEIDFAGMVAISTGDEFLQPRPKKASEAVQERFRTRLYIVALPATGHH